MKGVRERNVVLAEPLLVCVGSHGHSLRPGFDRAQ